MTKDNSPTETADQLSPKSAYDPPTKQLSKDVRAAGQDLKEKALETKDAVVHSARVIAADTRDLAHAGYEEARHKLMEHSSRTNAAVQRSLDDARQKVSSNPLPAVAWALGIGFFLGRFVINGR